MHPVRGAPTFVNREAELAILRSLVPPEWTESSLVVIQAPPGFGKSALTDRLLSELKEKRVPIDVAIVDPSIRRAGIRAHDGFFIQRFAENLSNTANGRNHPDFSTYLRNRGARTAREKSLVVRKIPTVNDFLTGLVDTAERFFAHGAHGAEQLLASDSRGAVKLATEYVEAVCQDHAMIAVVREAQQIDLQSLRFILDLNAWFANQHLFIEYTADGAGGVSSAHDKAITNAINHHTMARIVRVRPLKREPLERLIRTSIFNDPTLELTEEAYASWDGNVRSVFQLPYIDRTAESASDMTGTLALPVLDLTYGLEDHFKQLTVPQRMLVAIAVANIEAISKRSLFSIASQIDQLSTSMTWNDALDELVKKHRFIVEQSREMVRVDNEDVAAAVEANAGFTAVLILARTRLRDFYLEIVDAKDFTTASLPTAIRQALALCARTRDIAGMLRVVHRVSADIRHANDQSIYVDAIADAIGSKAALFQDEHELVDWAAALAYETGDWAQAERLLEALPDLTAYHGLLLACCKQEIGKHNEALDLVRAARPLWDGIDAQVAADLVEVLVSRAVGNTDRARALLNKLYGDDAAQPSPMFAYALRFSETVNEFPVCTAHVLESAERFAESNLPKSRAYSQLAAAMHCAREGRTVEAHALIDRATHGLAESVRAQHILLNNRAAVAMLDADPDFELCIELLVRGLRTVRDDYSELAILTNLAIAYGQSGAHREAVDCAERMHRILESPTFKDRDVFWSAGFAGMKTYERAGDAEKADEMRSFAARAGRRPTIYPEYWEYRFGMRTDVDPKFGYLLRFDYHPLFLSHWLIDLEGLELLKEGRPQ